jgi:predicted nucleotidyltransferase
MTNQQLAKHLGINTVILLDLQQILSNHLNSTTSVNAFGSRSRGNAKKFSDLDLCITGDNLSYTQLAKIKEELSESDIPIFIEVTQEADLSESFKEAIKKDFINIPF